MNEQKNVIGDKKSIKYFVLIILTIIIVTCAIIGTSFSLFNYNAPGRKENIIITGSSKPKLKCDPINADTSGANAPSLPSNMIPVCYNSEKNVWLKADSSNTNQDYRWYSYNNKVWANAVSTIEEGYTIGTTENDKVVNIENKTSYIESYTSSNKGVNSSTSSSIFTFTAGSNGTYSFDWSVSSEKNYDKLTITVNGTTLSDVNEVSDIKSGTYKDTATSGTTYTIIASYTKDSSQGSNDDNATIGNFVLPSGSTKITHTANSSYPDYQWNDTSAAVNSASSSYKIKDGIFVLGELSTGSLVNNYMCSDGTSTTCDTLYLIKEATDKIVSKVDSYSNIKTSQVRSDYLNAPVGTAIEMEHINTMWVWIPRFSAAKNGTYNGGTQSAPGAFNITFVSTSKTAHEAFNFNGAKSGFWFGKFELAGTIDVACKTETCDISKILIKPNQSILGDKSVSQYFMIVRSMEQNSNPYGFIPSEVDLHMIKNSEWGAAAYLSQSIYGKCTSSTSCKAIGINNADYITGCGATFGSAFGDPYGTYETEMGFLASTTQNIYGIYDMSGGTMEFTMGVYWDGTKLTSGASANYNSGFNGYLYVDRTTYTGGINYPESKYYNLYTTESAYTSAGYQHALVETAGWYGVYYKQFPEADYQWLSRGGVCGDTTDAGIFAYDSDDGKGNTVDSSRAVLFK